MKRLKDYTQDELANASRKDIEDLINVETADRTTALPIPLRPDKPVYQTVEYIRLIVGSGTTLFISPGALSKEVFDTLHNILERAYIATKVTYAYPVEEPIIAALSRGHVSMVKCVEANNAESAISLTSKYVAANAVYSKASGDAFQKVTPEEARADASSKVYNAYWNAIESARQKKDLEAVFDLLSVDGKDFDTVIDLMRERFKLGQQDVNHLLAKSRANDVTSGTELPSSTE